MERLVGVVQQVSLARDLPSLMGVVRDAARELTGADGATFILRDGQHCFYADENAIEPLWKGRRFPLETCVSGWAMRNRQAVAIEDIYVDPRVPHEAYRPTFVKSLVIVPIRSIDPIGAIGNYWAVSHPPAETEVKVLQALADTTAVAMENVQVYSELEQRVRKRTEELEEALRDLDGFSHSVSHDLRAPVRAINGFCELFAMDHGDQLDAEAVRKLGIIKGEAARMATLIDDLLTFARLGRKGLRVESVDMTSLVRLVLERLRAQGASAALDVRLGELPAANGDLSLLEQVWVNLLSNAIKFSAPRARPVIEIDGREEGGATVYRVRDNGIGFDPRYAYKLFQPFQRLHHEADFPGTGIGLALAQRIVTRHGGRIKASGVPDGGASFEFDLPSVPPSTETSRPS